MRSQADITNPYFQTAGGLRRTTSQVIEEIFQFIRADEKRSYKVMVGSDSEGLFGDACDFVTAVVVHRVGNGGRYFWRRIELPRFYTLRDRIIQEVLLSLSVAEEILRGLRSTDVPQFGFEIHVDVGENGETKAILQEVLGMVRAYNFEAKTKPESYAASKVADLYV